MELLVWVYPLAVALAGLAHPRAGLLILVAGLPLFGSPPGGPYLAALDVAAIAAIATAALRRGARPGVDWTLFGLVLVSLLASIPVAYRPPSWRPDLLLDLVKALPAVETASLLYTWRALADLLLGWGLYRAIRRHFTRADLRALALAVLTGLALALVAGLADQVGVLDLTAYRAALGNVRADRMLSVFFNPGWFAEYVVIAAPLAAIAALGGRRGASVALPGVAVLSLLCLALTQQRGSWLAAAAQLAFLAWAGGGRILLGDRGARRMLGFALLFGLLTVATLVLARPATFDGLTRRVSHVGKGLANRVPLWTAGLEMVRDRPLLGWGPGSFNAAYDERFPPGSPERTRFAGTAHNLYLNTAAETGLLGLLALGVVAAALVHRLRWSLRRLRGDARRMALAVAASFVGIAVYGLVQHMLFLRCIAWLIWILIGAVAVLAPLPQRRSSVAARCLIAAAVLLVPLRWVAEPLDSPTNRSFGLHAVETTVRDGAEKSFRWTAGRAAWRVQRAGDRLGIDLANGHPLGARAPVEVALSIDGVALPPLTLEDGWVAREVELAGDGTTVLLEVEARPTFRPFTAFRGHRDLEPSNDVRELGVVIGELRWSARAGGRRESGAQTPGS